ncbi:MAG: hypothetical protein JWQ50_9363 [Caballeronia mineralivorans]|jgi:hypothetical protein|nr:hypothetical protein [Caballeronia mineralivorans]
MDTAPEIRTLPIPIIDDPCNGIDWLLLAAFSPMAYFRARPTANHTFRFPANRRCHSTDTTLTRSPDWQERGRH